ncbi:hypothetical protein AVEN_231234-1 [Araneus ventricosus]|uniref:CCHC-type domain-containing protein n=1 Tax=Araneus ventricosus TaxID=182803 RepID=A0A4Y2VKY3_ARAVE|nr:hypothetical protein AVEN_231234-1 [Araneus ventricosus]
MSSHLKTSLCQKVNRTEDFEAMEMKDFKKQTETGSFLKKSTQAKENEDTDSEVSESLYKDAESSDEDGGGSHPHPTPVAGSPSWKVNYDWLGENSDEDGSGSPHPTYVAATASPHSKEYLEDAQFVKDFLISTVGNRKKEEENRKQQEKMREEEIQREERHIEREHELELARIRTARNDENRSPLTNVTSNEDGDISLDKLIKGVEILKIPVLRKTESWNLFFDSLERAYKHKKVPEEFQAEILLKLLGDKASNVLVYIKEEDLKDYAKVKALILKEFEPTPQTCLENFQKAKRNSGETHIQFVSRLTSTWEYYCKLRKQGEKWLRSQGLAKECDIYFGAKQKSFDEPRNDLRRTFPSEKYVPSHQRREISRRDTDILKRKECFVCGSLLHLARECPDKRKRNEFVPKQNDKNIHKNSNSNKNRSANQEAAVAKVDSSHLQSESVQNLVTPLKNNIYIHSKEIESIIDSGTQISIIHSSLIPDLKDQEGSKILQTPAFGGQIEAKICRVSIYYKNSGNNLFNNVDTLIAVTDKLNVPCLITPGIYELLAHSADISHFLMTK